MSITELKQRSREQLKDYWGKGAAVSAIYLVISIVLSSMLRRANLDLTIIENLLLVFITLGIISFCFNVIKKTAAVEDIFSQGKIFLKGLAISAIISGPGIILTILATVKPERITSEGVMAFYGLSALILTIASIVLALMYAMAHPILVENPDTSIANALNQSNKLMKGNKWKLILMFLSFIGWFILSILTFGIGFLWLMPYVQMTTVNFYLDIKNKKE